MDTLRQISLQEANEERFNKKHIDRKIKDAIQSNPNTMEKIEQGIELVRQYMAGEYYDSKMRRIEQLKDLKISEMVMDIFIGVATVLRAELFTSVSAKLAARLGFSDKTEAITTVAELLAVLCHTDAFDIFKEDQMSSLMLVSRIDLPVNVVRFIEESQYLPPMVCSPLKLTHNFSSGYLTHNDSLVLGKGNHHDGDLCLDVLNTMNSVPLSLATDFLSAMDEEPTFEVDSQEKMELWNAFKRQSMMIYLLMVEQGNRLYMTHKVDKRGRIYSCGYHINPQGASYKKAMLELADAEVIDIPEQFRK